MVVLDPNMDDAAVEALNNRVASLVSQRGGSINSLDNWGKKRLAYPIGRYRDGIYILTRMQLPPNAAEEIERALKLTESVIRHLLVRAEGLTTSPAAPAERLVART